MESFVDSKTQKHIVVYDAKTYEYGSRNQRRFADSVCAKYILVTGDNRGRLPNWIKRILKDNNLWFKKIGRTTYKTNTFALYPDNR